MSRLAVLAAVLALVAPAIGLAAGNPQPLPLAASPEAVGFDSQRLQRLDDYMAGAVAQGRVSGMTTLLARHGKIVEFKVYGKPDFAAGRPLERDALFRIFSMSKPLTGVAMMILFEEGKWRLDDPVSRYVPEFKALRVMTGVDAQGNILTEDAAHPPTMRELMSHTAGFGYGLSDSPVDRLYAQKQVMASNSLHQMVERTADIPLKFQPGSNWEYSSAVDIQGYIVERLSGQTLGAFLEDHVFKPLGMNDTGFYVRPEAAARLVTLYAADPKTGQVSEAKQIMGAPANDYTRPPPMELGGQGIVSTTSDYARFSQMLLNKGELDGVRILSPATIALMGSNVIPHSVLVSANGAGTGPIRFNEGTGFGLDLMVVMDPQRSGTLEGKGTMSWGGAGGTWFWVDPTNDVIFVGMTQRLFGTGGDDLGVQARTLTYQALTHPEK